MLEGLGLVSIRQGSGITVLDFRTEAGLGILPYYLRSGRQDMPTRTLIDELLRMRRVVAGEIVRMAAVYADPEDVEALREHVYNTLAVRADRNRFILMDMEFYRKLTLLTAVLPVIWMNNMLRGVVQEILVHYASMAPIPKGYLATYEKLLYLVKARDADEASRTLVAHFERHDRDLVRRLVAGIGSNVLRKGKKR